MGIKFDQESNIKAVQADRSYLEIFEHDIAALCPERLAKMYRLLALELTLAGERRQAFQAALRATRYRISPATLSALPMPLMPKVVLVPILKRYFMSRGLKLA